MLMKALLILSAGVAGTLALLSPLRGQAPVAPVAPPAPAAPAGPAVDLSTVLDYAQDPSQRMTVPVNIDGAGPYQFVVDTGAERTVIATELARRLKLSPGLTSTVHSMTEVSRIETVVIPDLQVAGTSVRGINAPALSQVNLGAEGMLGVDSLQQRRVSFDFVRREMTIDPSHRREEKWPKDVIVVTGRNRFGHLVLVDASVDGQRVWVIVDTGSQVTVANNALRRKLASKGRLGPTLPVEMLSVTGGRMMVDQTKVKLIRIGGVDIVDMPMAFADVHPFRKLDLLDRPAILLGMDALQLFQRVSVDFAARRMKLLPKPRSSLEPQTQMARAGKTRPAG
jgi:predicted aspartyl protease